MNRILFGMLARGIAAAGTSLHSGASRDRGEPRATAESLRRRRPRLFLGEA